MLDETRDILRTQRAIFLDFEASSLYETGWPIEIGLARVEGGRVEAESLLIRPHPDWDPDGWSEESAEIHGIERGKLEAEGVDAVDAAHWFRERNTGLMITDAPEFEQRWLIRLLATDPPFPQVRLLDFDSYIRMSLPDAAAVSRVYAALEAQGPAPHRAREDAARLAAAWLAGANRVQAPRSAIESSIRCRSV